METRGPAMGFFVQGPLQLNNTLDTLIAVGGYRTIKNTAGPVSMPGHSHVELFTLSNSKWQNKRDYPLKSIYSYSILAVESKFIIFGGKTDRNNDKSSHKKL